MLLRHTNLAACLSNCSLAPDLHGKDIVTFASPADISRWKSGRGVAGEGLERKCALIFFHTIRDPNIVQGDNGRECLTGAFGEIHLLLDYNSTLNVTLEGF